MERCFQLARMGAGNVAPNPMVGSVLVHGRRIIGEGYHMQYGQAHAEVNCISSVAKEDRHLIAESTIYVSLEPCAHFGKTPPCCDLIIKHKIPKVVIACRDSFEKVNGEGIKKLLSAGIEVVENVLQQKALELNKRFFTFNKLKRPYIILKWAQSANGCISAADRSPVKISNDLTNKLVHRWRSEESAIVVGTNTALQDDPALTNRWWTGHQPVRIVIDEKLVLPISLKLFDQSVRTIVINRMKQSVNEHLQYEKAGEQETSVDALLRILYQQQLNSVIVEGGAKLLQSFIDAGIWNEARIITNQSLVIENGLKAPVLKDGVVVSNKQIKTDHIQLIKNP